MGVFRDIVRCWLCFVAMCFVMAATAQASAGAQAQPVARSLVAAHQHSSAPAGHHGDCAPAVDERCAMLCCALPAPLVTPLAPPVCVGAAPVVSATPILLRQDPGLDPPPPRTAAG